MKELRKKLRIIRKSIDTPTRKKQGKKLLYQCQKHAIFRNAKHIAIFTPNDGEIETIDTINFNASGLLCIFADSCWGKTKVCKDG